MSAVLMPAPAAALPPPCAELVPLDRSLHCQASIKILYK